MAILSRRSLLAALAMMAAVPGPAQAQGLSDRNIFIIVPFTPGSGPDVLARIVGEELRKRWNQPVIIDNKPGASGNIGAGRCGSHGARWSYDPAQRQHVPDECRALQEPAPTIL